MRLNRGQQAGTPCGMILSGVPGVGKATAVKALGRGWINKPAESPQTRKQPDVSLDLTDITELLYFLGAPYAPQDERDGAHPPGMPADDRPEDQPGHRR